MKRAPDTERAQPTRHLLIVGGQERAPHPQTGSTCDRSDNRCLGTGGRDRGNEVGGLNLLAIRCFFTSLLLIYFSRISDNTKPFLLKKQRKC